MRVATLYVLVLPATAAAQDQIPLFDRARGWLNQAAAFAKSVASAGRDAATASLADRATTQITWQNWKSTLRHSGVPKPYDPPEAWMVYVTGGNKTCHRRCARADSAWNEAVTYLAADPGAPRLGSIDCEAEQLLCGAWATRVPCIWFFLFPPPAQPSAAVSINVFPMNLSSVTTADITHIHTRKLYMETPKYEGPLHPFNGWVAQYGLMDPLAYALYYISIIPSWAFLIFISLVSRYYVNKRMPQPGSGYSSSGSRAQQPASTSSS